MMQLAQQYEGGFFDVALTTIRIRFRSIREA